MAIEQRRADGELLGALVQDGDRFVPVDLLGRPLSRPVEQAEGERLLAERGLGYLADPYELETDEGVFRVRIVEVLPDRVRVKLEDLGAIDAPQRLWTLPNPVPATLRPR